jgi:hypothetical protein
MVYLGTKKTILERKRICKYASVFSPPLMDVLVRPSLLSGSSWKPGGWMGDRGKEGAKAICEVV